MTLRYALPLVAGLATAAFATAATATPSFDGIWKGITSKGEAVQLTIDGSKVTAYKRAGVDVPVKGVHVSPNTLIIDQPDGQTRLSPGKGASVRYAVSDGKTTKASATLLLQ